MCISSGGIFRTNAHYCTIVDFIHIVHFLALCPPLLIHNVSHSFYFHWVNIAKDKIAPTIFNPQCV